MMMNDMSKIVRHMRMYAERSNLGIDLGFPEQLVLMHLSQREESNQESIAKALGVDKGAIAKTIAKLEAKGLVSRRQSDANRREKTVRLTEGAWDVLGLMAESFQEWEQRIFAGISSDQRLQLEGVLARMAANSTEYMKEGR